MGKIKVYLIKKDKSIEVCKKPFHENKVFLGKNQEILFEPEHVFLRKRGRFLPPEPCLIIQEGKTTPEKLPNPDGDFLIPMTTEEIRKFIKREVAKSITEIKPIKLNMFIILFLFLLINLIINIMILAGWRIRL